MIRTTDFRAIQAIASTILAAFEQSTRKDGSTFWALTDEARQQWQDLMHHAHADMLPDDWRYELIRRALDALANADTEDEARDSLVLDVYTSELTDWLHSHDARLNYVDQAVSEYGHDRLFYDLQRGQFIELEEVFAILVQELTDYAERQDNED